jgi:predicted amidophosphoribosyltransferase
VHPYAHGQLASIVAPPVCAACAAPCGSGSVLCGECDAELAAARRVCEPGPPGVDMAVAVSEFDGVARRIVHGLKYGRRLSLARVAAAAMLATLAEGGRVAGAVAGHNQDEATLAVVPVPAGPLRWRWRGFDPAEELSIAIAKRAGIPLSACLRRSRGRRQVGRRRSERLSDPPRVWAVGSAPASALLVDDVWTTGATLSACAGALRGAGCDRVVALTLARAT